MSLMAGRKGVNPQLVDRRGKIKALPELIKNINQLINGEKLLGNAIGNNGWNQLSNLGKNITNETTDTRTILYLRSGLNESPWTPLFSHNFASPGVKDFIATASFTGGLRLVHSGATTDINFSSNYASVIESHKYFVHVNCTGVNPSEAGGVVISDFMLIDLTRMFGAGNEPGKVEDFRAVFSADYYPYSNANINAIGDGLALTGGTLAVSSENAIKTTRSRAVKEKY